MQKVMESLTKASVENQLLKFMTYASRPLSEFNIYEALDMVDAIQRCAHDSKSEKASYYRLVYQTARDKTNLPAVHYRALLLRLLGDKNYEKVGDAVSKVEKSYEHEFKTDSQTRSVSMNASGRFHKKHSDSVLLL